MKRVQICKLWVFRPQNYDRVPDFPCVCYRASVDHRISYVSFSLSSRNAYVSKKICDTLPMSPWLLWQLPTRTKFLITIKRSASRRFYHMRKHFVRHSKLWRGTGGRWKPWNWLGLSFSEFMRGRVDWTKLFDREESWFSVYILGPALNPRSGVQCISICIWHWKVLTYDELELEQLLVKFSPGWGSIILSG